MHDSQHLLIVDLVVALCIRESLCHEGDWLVCAICLHLGEYCSGHKVGGIAFKVEATRLGREGEDRGGGDSLLQGIECLLLRQTPDPPLGLASECIEGVGNIGEVTDKLPIEVHKAKEGLDLLDLHWGQPFCDSTDLHQIHSHMVFRDDQSEVFDLLLLKLAFLWLEN